jgi:outer membrane protein OmpA-like peptidoglycan-associated protein
MFDVCKSKALQLKAKLEGVNLAPLGRWLPVTALLVIAGCSWFEEEPTPPAPSEQAKATTPAPGEGETMGGDEQEAQVPDINSVPNEVPKPSIVNLDQVQEGLGADTGNAQHTDETLTMPSQSAARPEKPVEETAPQTAQVGATAPETPETTEVAPAPEPALAPTPEPASAPAVEAMPAPEPAPATVAEPEPTPEPAAQVAQVGTPQPGSKPFEPSGPLNLAPGSLSRTPQEPAAVANAPAAGTPATTPADIAATPLPGSSAAPMTAMAPMAPTPSPAPSADNVSVDYSVLNGLQAGAPVTGYSPATGGVAPVQGYSPSGSIPGVGQAVGYVYFGNGSSHLSTADRQVLQQVAQLQRIQGGVLRIIGHASARTGNMEALEQQQVNHDVSMERATAVARALVEYGVQPILVQVAAAGDDQTLYAESTPAGEAGNRRAEVYLSQN